MKTGPTWGWLVCAAFAIAGAAVLALQAQRVQQLRGEISLKRDAEAEVERLRRIRDELARQQVPADELEKLRADRAALARLRTEINTLKAQAERTLTKKTPPAPPPLIPASQWKNAGRATPEAVLETTLWAAAGGDVDALAKGLVFEPGAREKVETLIASLPADARRQYSTPEHLVALLTAKDIPTEGGVRFMARDQGADERVMAVVFQNEKEKRLQNKFLITRRVGEEWKLVVPHAAVAKYTVALKGAAPASNAK
jgi:hypothetical protein